MFCSSIKSIAAIFMESFLLVEIYDVCRDSCRRDIRESLCCAP
jgi:hypothetical protein